jgi:toxin ParE1/3/4
MGRVRKTAQARADLDEIWSYIAKDSVSAADELIDRIAQRGQTLADYPHLGVARPDIAPQARLLTIGNYLVLYSLTDSDALIVRVVHGASRLEGLFDEGV